MSTISRRDWLVASTLGGAALLTGCVTHSAASKNEQFSPEERILIQSGREDFDIVVQSGPGSRVLRTRAREVSPCLELKNIFKRMEATMHKAEGVGIAGPQVGLSFRIAALMIDCRTETPRMVYACNPVIIERSDDTSDGYEGCLSVPEVGSMVRRNRWIKVAYDTPEGKSVVEEAEGFNAVLWQHELDHLDGILYVDRRIGEIMPYEKIRRLRKKAEEAAEKPSARADSMRSAHSLEFDLLKA